MHRLPGSDDEIIIQLETMIAQMKQEKHTAYHGLHCYL